MSGVGDQEIDQAVEDGVFEDVKSACVALVPVTTPVQYLLKRPLPRPDPTFVTQLMASAEQARSLRRATSIDAQMAYERHRRPVVSFRTRQVI
jgi:hypothetical protein